MYVRPGVVGKVVRSRGNRGPHVEGARQKKTHVPFDWLQKVPEGSFLQDVENQTRKVRAEIPVVLFGLWGRGGLACSKCL